MSICFLFLALRVVLDTDGVRALAVFSVMREGVAIDMHALEVAFF